MTNRYLLFPVFCLAIGVCSLLSCKKESIDNNDNGFQIQLTGEKQGRNIVLNWTETNITNFERYIVVRSTSPIPDDPTPPAGQSITSIEDYKTPTFEDASFPLTEVLYYKVYVEVGDRFLSSTSISVENEVKLLKIQPNRILFDTEHDRVFMFDGNKSTLYKYSYSTEQLEDSIVFSGFFDVKMALGNHGSGDELYVAPNNSTTLRIYNPDNLEQITTMTVNGIVFNIASGNNGFLYLATDNWQNSFSVYKRSTKQFVDGDASFSGFGETLLSLASSDGFSVFNASFNQLVKYEISAQGIIQNINFGFINNFFGSLQNIVTSHDRQFFITDVGGTIISNDLGIEGMLTDNVTLFFNDLTFAQDDTRIWALTTSVELAEFSFPNSQIKSRTTLNYSPLRLVQDGDQLIIVGLVFDNFGNTRTIIDELNID